MFYQRKATARWQNHLTYVEVQSDTEEELMDDVVVAANSLAT